MYAEFERHVVMSVVLLAGAALSQAHHALRCGRIETGGGANPTPAKRHRDLLFLLFTIQNDKITKRSP